LGASADGGYRLYVDDKLFIDDWAPHGERAMTTMIHLQAGHPYAIKLEYFHRAWESAVRLLWLPPNLAQEAVDVARKSDVVVAVVGITAQLEGEESDSNDPGFFGGDRTDLSLPRPQEDLLEELAATGKPIVVVLTSGSALSVNWIDDHAAAILQTWYPGEEGGAALADVLSGDYNPAGRLPVTFYKSLAQVPPFSSYSMFGRTYRYFNEQPLFAFGYGLSYSTFVYSDDTISAAESDGSGTITASVRVMNSSSIPGDEVVELYVSHPGIEGAPIRALAGFQRIHLGAHASRAVSFQLSPRELSIVDPQGNRLVPAGAVEIWLGSGQPSAPSRQSPANGRALKMTITNSFPVSN
jgi:beta-glucosidase